MMILIVHAASRFRGKNGIGHLCDLMHPDYQVKWPFHFYVPPVMKNSKRSMSAINPVTTEIIIECALLLKSEVTIFSILPPNAQCYK